MKLIASILKLNRADVQALRITDTYSLHRVVYGLYEDIRSDTAKAQSQGSGILWADQGGDARGWHILMLANRPPAEQAEGGHGEVQSKLIPAGFLEHEHYRFQVAVNPTRRDSASRKLVPVKGRDAIAAWFAERAPQSWGFMPVPEHLQVGRVQVLRFKGKSGHPITLAQAQIEGQLKVSDPAQFARSFAQGIGRGRAFGCGLLQIVPIPVTSPGASS